MLDRKEESLDAIISIHVKLEDIEEEATKRVKLERQKVALPGFRKGKVPLGIVKKHLWQGILTEELEKKIDDFLDTYLNENNIDTINPVLPIIPEKQIDLTTDTEFEFKFHIGIKEEIKINEIELFGEIQKFEVQITEEDVDSEIEKLKKIYKKFEKSEIIEHNDDIDFSIKITELNESGQPLEGGITKTKHLLFASLDEQLKNLFTDKK